ncbi:response regulator [cf. Phormidesmis sp. LEGE 11477]|uniref:response regulator n=1 Tax=cf. Phormidesmis sp. LEGE 11477 TaxID=1828680 RepID=UPI001882511C|nr:response regulator [cf. Phormidesmis sp. LEGE 11477]MBE9062112.1 response regulator [cf. Phormidesmis sp. LEGE 11477]
MKFLLVEDDKALAGAIEQLLLAHHYVMDWATDGVEGRGMAEVFPYDLILMDWMLPKLDGIQLCQQLRSEGNDTPIILLTARDASTDRVAGLDAGADDYLVKPFEFEELLARIRALLRRAEGIITPVLRWGDLQLDPRSSKVTCGSVPIALTPKEYALLELFLRNPSRIFSLDSLLDKVWPFEDAPTVASVRTHIKGLRQKLKKVGLSDVIATVYGLGYRLRSIESPSDQESLTDTVRPDAAAFATAKHLDQPLNKHLDLASLWQGVSQDYLQRITAVAKVLHRLRPGQIEQNVRQQLLSEAHALAGSLGSFGFKSVAAQWREIEAILHAHADLSADLIRQMEEQVALVIRSLRQMRSPNPSAPSLVPSPLPSLATPLAPLLALSTPASAPISARLTKEFPSAPPSASIFGELPSEPLRLLVVRTKDDSQPENPSPVWLQTLEEIAVRYQIEVSIADSIDRARAQIFSAGNRDRLVSELTPHIVVFDFDNSLELQTNDSADLKLIAELQTRQPLLPTIVLTTAASFESRVNIARLGVARVLQTPVSPTEILETVVRIVQKGRSPAAKLLAVDDDPTTLTLLQQLLPPCRFQLHCLSDSTQFWQTLERIEPDLILLDIQMPQFSGFDLCRVVRSDPRWHELPILFMSAYTDEQTVQTVFAVGADDYIRKPILAPELVARVLGWLERSHARRFRSEIDSLTGIYNRRKSTQSLNRLLRLAKQQHQPLCFALIDLDHFKQINDRYGHLVGDYVLRRFGTCLRSTFHGDAVVARWAGEEFAIGFYGVDALEGAQRLYQLIQVWQAETLTIHKELSLEDLEDTARKSSLAITFSAGVAVYPQAADDLQELYIAADRALHKAKESRSRVELAV